MSFFFYKLFGSLIVPPGLLAIILLLFALHVSRKKRSLILSVMLLLLSFTVYFISTPFGATKITGPLEDRFQAYLPEDEKMTAILLLSGGSSYDNEGNAVQPGAFTLERVFGSVNLAKEKDIPIIFSGGKVYGSEEKSEAEVMAVTARKMGYEGEVILEDKSRTTEENLFHISELINSKGLLLNDDEKNEEEVDLNLVLVTNAFHMERSLMAAKRHLPEAKIYPYPSGRLTNPRYSGIQDLLPDGHSFMVSSYGIKEWLGIRVYKILKDDDKM